MPDTRSITDVLDKLDAASSSENEIRVRRLVEAMGDRSHGPFLFLPAVLDMSPIGSIPGVPTVLAVVIIVFAGQLAIGRQHLWLPTFVAERRVSSSRLRKSVAKLRRAGRWMDRWFHGRLQAFTTEPFVRGAGFASLILALAMPPLEVFPFATTLVSAPIALFGVALITRDGALMLAAFAATLWSAGGAVWIATT
ncbi:exopolysaccharide biosynthesis protein [Roseomonas terrae]|uniref:Exopolysaccharide biosynthesis protein n=1 Tax=Neoroseomonas terrae TaxID=424799 RepID=A0ABS5EM73_9PROT|nr:exopolysaccharide biosynthesis protein [Neoroseomonas terrae]MBR0652103.1 exopolysaccharide biosynthesis protein [Neoroseomonas terrae]